MHSGYLVTVKKKADEYEALYYREKYKNKEELFIEKLEDKGYSVIDSTVEFKNYHNLEKPILIKYQLEESNDIINNKLYLSPFFEDIISDNPLKQNKRTYPIDFVYSYKKTFSSKILIPDNYVVDYLPKERNIDNSLFLLNYTVSNDNESINISLSYQFKKAIYSGEEYARIKYYFNEIVKLGSEIVVLQKENIN